MGAASTVAPTAADDGAIDIPQHSPVAARTASGGAAGAEWQDVSAAAGIEGSTVVPIEQPPAKHWGHQAEASGTRKTMESAPISARRLMTIS